MSQSNRDAVSRAIRRMHVDLGEPLTIDDLARTAMYSKYHFTRVFERATGVSPGRFLSAIRLAEAKRQLRETSLTVTEISHSVGWSSVGSFTTRFSVSVGVSPSAYRCNPGLAPLPRVREPAARQPVASTALRGTIRGPDRERPGYVFVGLFRDRIAQGRPAACALFSSVGEYVLSPVPAGRWRILACGIPPQAEHPDGLVVEGLDRPLVGASNLVPVTAETTTIRVDVELREVGLYDPPLLLSLAHLTPPLTLTATELSLGRIPSPRPGRPGTRIAGAGVASQRPSLVRRGPGADALDPPTSPPLPVRR